MKNLFRTIFAPILNIFEKGDEPYAHKPLNRKILIVFGVMLSGLVAGIVAISSQTDTSLMEYIIPVVVFGLVALVALVVGLLGTDRAVAKIWGGK
jgi:hypothetical protein